MGQESWSVTTIVAIYGAVLSTIAIIWNIIREITNRGRLRVNVSRAQIFLPGEVRIDVSSGAVNIHSPDKLWYKVTNVGRQPLWLSQIGGGTAGGKEFLLATTKQLPIKLDPGETFDDFSAEASQLDKHLDGPEKVTFLGAWDTLGKIHKLPRRRLKVFLKELRERKKSQ